MAVNNDYRYQTVMIIDDNPIDRYVAERTIKKFGFSEQVICMESALDALDYLREAATDLSKIPQLIFLDINMPEMNGFEFLNEYNSLSDEIKKHSIIMMLTTSLNDIDRTLAENNRYVYLFLNKPLTREKLEEIRTL